MTAVILGRLEFISARQGNCELLVRVVYAAYTAPPSNPATGAKRATEFIKTTPLADCGKYAGHFIP